MVMIKKLDEYFQMMYYEYLKEVLDELIPIYADSEQKSISRYVRNSDIGVPVFYTIEEFLDMKKEFEELKKVLGFEDLED